MDSQAAETLTFNCPACNISLRVPRSMAGISGPCPKCRVEISAPQSSREDAQSMRRSTSLPGIIPGAKHEDQSMQDDYLLSSEPEGELSLEGGSRRTDLPQNTIAQSPIHSPRRNIAPSQPLTGPKDQDPVTTDISLPSRARPAQTGKSQPQSDQASTKKKTQLRIKLHPLSLILVILLSAGSGVVAMLLINEFNGSALKLSQLPFLEGKFDQNSGWKTPPITPKKTRYKPLQNPAAAIQATIPPPTPPKGPVATKPATPPSPTTADPHAHLPDPEIGVDAARSVLDAFLAANTVTERIKHVQTPDFVTPKMEIYYSKYPLNLNVTGIAHELSGQVPQSHRQFHIFQLTTPQHPSGFPVSVEETIHGCLVDWTSFVQFHDNLLGKFIRIYQPQPDTFHAILERAHYFRSDVPGLGSKFCFRIKPPIPGYEGHAFIEHDSPLAARIEQKFKWDRIYFPVLKMQWIRTTDGTRYIEIKDIVQDSWRAIQ